MYFTECYSSPLQPGATSCYCWSFAGERISERSQRVFLEAIEEIMLGYELKDKQCLVTLRLI